jgi:hypothetical protein
VKIWNVALPVKAMASMAGWPARQDEDAPEARLDEHGRCLEGSEPAPSDRHGQGRPDDRRGPRLPAQRLISATTPFPHTRRSKQITGLEGCTADTPLNHLTSPMWQSSHTVWVNLTRAIHPRTTAWMRTAAPACAFKDVRCWWPRYAAWMRAAAPCSRATCQRTRDARAWDWIPATAPMVWWYLWDVTNSVN